MLSISVEEFLFWKKKQLSKGGDFQSFSVLLDCIGGISTSYLKLLSINSEGNLHIKKNLDGILFPIGLMFEKDNKDLNIKNIHQIVNANFLSISFLVSKMFKN